MMRVVLVLAIMTGSAVAAETAESIMRRVAENQDRAEAARTSMVYEQDVLIRLHRGKQKLAREEEYQFVVTPTPNSIEKKRVGFSGKYEKDGVLHSYSEPGYHYKEVDIDADLAKDLVDDLTGDQTRDGLSKDLFPFRSEELDHYRFRLKGRQMWRGQDVYEVTFLPVSKPGEDGRIWAGEILVNAVEFQPVVITTRMAKGIPLAVRTLLGTDVRHLGFKVSYERFDNGVWMPVTYGGELKLKAVFFYKRDISLSLRNSGFRRAKVDSAISYQLPEDAPEH